MLDIQTVRNLFEAYLQTAFLSSEDLVDLIRIRGESHREIIMNGFDEIRNDYLDNLDNGSEDHIEEYIDRLCKSIKRR